MSVHGNRSDPPALRPLSNWLIAAGAVVVLGVVAVIWFVLLRRYGGEGAQVQLDAIRTAGTLVIGTGGAVALLLTARRQRYTELTLVHTDRDATERRITELYTKAADQLGSDQAAVRLAGLYALERLAHSTLEHRQSIVDVICAYLRMPYTPSQSLASTLGQSYRSPAAIPRRRARIPNNRSLTTIPTSWQMRREYAEQEEQVRLAAQNILFRNMRVAVQQRRGWYRTITSTAPAWPGIRLDLTGALLLQFSLRECQLEYADFTRAQFVGATDFSRAQFTHGASFEGAQFSDRVDFSHAQFSDATDFESVRFADWSDFSHLRFVGATDFEDARFADWAYFVGVEFIDWAYFVDAQFVSRAYFEGAQFTGTADFEGAQFIGRVEFSRAWFYGRVNFGNAQFMGRANFDDVQFADVSNFTARVASTAEPSAVWPSGWRTRSAEPDNGEDPAFRYLTKC